MHAVHPIKVPEWRHVFVESGSVNGDYENNRIGILGSMVYLFWCIHLLFMSQYIPLTSVISCWTCMTSSTTFSNTTYYTVSMTTIAYNHIIPHRQTDSNGLSTAAFTGAPSMGISLPLISLCSIRQKISSVKTRHPIWLKPKSHYRGMQGVTAEYIPLCRDNDNDDEDDDSIQFIGIGIRLISNDFSTILVCAQNQCCIQEMWCEKAKGTKKANHLSCNNDTQRSPFSHCKKGWTFGLWLCGIAKGLINCAWLWVCLHFHSNAYQYSPRSQNTEQGSLNPGGLWLPGIGPVLVQRQISGRIWPYRKRPAVLAQRAIPASHSEIPQDTQEINEDLHQALGGKGLQWNLYDSLLQDCFRL